MKKHFYLRKVFSLKGYTILLLLLLSLFTFNIPSALAHRPHDVVEEVAVSPSFSQDQTVYIVVRNNLFKSMDGGASWQRVVRGLDNYYSLSSLVLSPQTKEILFLGSLGDGVYRSQDGAASWQKANQGLKDLEIRLLGISPHSSSLVLAAGNEQGLYKTKNGGDNWYSVLQNNVKVTAIAFAPDNEKQILIGNQDGSIYLSKDGGEVWEKLYEISEAGRINALAASPTFSKDQKLFIGTEKQGLLQTVDQGKFLNKFESISDANIRDIELSPQYQQDNTIILSTWDKGVLISNDAGQTWRNPNQGITKDKMADDMKVSHFYEIQSSPTFAQDQTIFLGGFDGLFKSHDAGQNWQELETLSLATITGLSLAPNDNNQAAVGISTYVGESYLSQDSGESWKPINQNLYLPRFTRTFDNDPKEQDPRRFFDITLSPSFAKDNTIFLPILWNKYLRSSNEGKSWDILAFPKGGRGSTIAASPNFANDKTVYLLHQGEPVYRSTDGGKTFSIVGKLGKQKGNDPPSLVISPNFASDQTLYASGPNGVHKSVDGGKTWTSVTQATNLEQRKGISLAISPNYENDQTVLFGSDQGVFITRNAGQSWQKLVVDPSNSNLLVEGVAISPDYQNDGTILVSARGKGLYKSGDQGQSFQPIGDANLAFARLNDVPSASMPIQFSPNYASDKTIYGFGSARLQVYKSVDAGETWQVLSLDRATIDDNYGFFSYLGLASYVYQGRILRFALSAIAGILTYFLLGFIALKKKLPFNKLLIKLGGSILVFLVAFGVLMVL